MQKPANVDRGTHTVYAQLVDKVCNDLDGVAPGENTGSGVRVQLAALRGCALLPAGNVLITAHSLLFTAVQPDCSPGLCYPWQAWFVLYQRTCIQLAKQANQATTSRSNAPLVDADRGHGYQSGPLRTG